MKAGVIERNRGITAAHVLALWPVLLAGMLILSGCAPFRPGLPSEPLPPRATNDAGLRIARTALRYVGVPYRYGGSEPSKGFDCSGLVSYVHGVDGITVPRTAASQFAAARPVASKDLRPGDLVFFRRTPGSRAVSHVGIYTGAGRFVHAPQTGRNVGESRLEDDYYRERFAGAGRYYATSGGRSSGVKAPR
jgi:murein DD-endopeptidase